jgi:hypothetical protein
MVDLPPMATWAGDRTGLFMLLLVSCVLNWLSNCRLVWWRAGVDRLLSWC